MWASLWLSGKRIRLPTEEMQVQFLSCQDPLEEMATHSNILAWEIPWTEEPRGLHPWGCKRFRHNLVTKQQQICSFLSDHSTHMYTQYTFFFFLQFSFLFNLKTYHGHLSDGGPYQFVASSLKLFSTPHWLHASIYLTTS